MSSPPPTQLLIGSWSFLLLATLQRPYEKPSFERRRMIREKSPCEVKILFVHFKAIYICAQPRLQKPKVHINACRVSDPCWSAHTVSGVFKYQWLKPDNSRRDFSIPHIEGVQKRSFGANSGGSAVAVFCSGRGSPLRNSCTLRPWRWCRGCRCRQTCARWPSRTPGSRCSWSQKRRLRVLIAASPPTSVVFSGHSTPACETDRCFTSTQVRRNFSQLNAQWRGTKSYWRSLQPFPHTAKAV